jgi:hypothetical protein
MKRVTVLSTSILLLVLAWLALDDITTGGEPSHTLEWAMVAVTAIWFSVIGCARLLRS